MPFLPRHFLADDEEMLYKIVYEDDDREEIFEEELEEIMVKKSKHHKHHKHKKRAIILSGTLSCIQSKQGNFGCHVLKGEWSFGNLTPQKFELSHNLSEDDGEKSFPSSGRYKGSFVYEQKEGNTVTHEIVKESNVMITFSEKKGDKQSLRVKGKVSTSLSLGRVWSTFSLLFLL